MCLFQYLSHIGRDDKLLLIFPKYPHHKLKNLVRDGLDNLSLFQFLRLMAMGKKVFFYFLIFELFEFQILRQILYHCIRKLVFRFISHQFRN